MINHGQIAPEAFFTYCVEEENTITRIDSYITSKFSHYSRSFFQHLIHQKMVSINGIIVTKPSATPSVGNIITITFPPTRTIEKSVVTNKTAQVSIEASTDHFMIIYKPAHLLVHAPSTFSTAITLTDWILHNHSDLARVGIIDRPGIVHRLDKETSGIMIITRTNHAHTVFTELFKKREIAKTYLAIVAGHPDKQGTITLAIGRDPHVRIKMATFNENIIDEQQKASSLKIRQACTHYKVIEYFKDSTLIEVKPTTGRTHQIRVHMTAIGHPLIGDQLYGQKSPLIDRQALHAQGLTFSFDEKKYTFTNNPPEDFQKLLNSLRTF